MKSWLAWLVCMAILMLSPKLHAQAGESRGQGASAESVALTTTVVWDTLDSNGRSDGFIVATKGSNNTWSWTRYTKQPNGTHVKSDEGTAELSSENPIVYTWTSTETGHSGTANIDEDQEHGTWNDETAGTSKDIRKSS